MKPDTKGTLLPLAVLLAVGLAFTFVGCSKREIPSTRKSPPLVAWVPISGKSMLPTYPERALAEAEFGVPYDELKVGDVVIFWDYTKPQPAFTLHTLVQKQAGNWIAKGNNPETNPVADRPWVTRDNYAARATGRHTQILVAPLQ